MTTSHKITGILLDSLVFSAKLLFGVVLFFSITIPIMRSLQRSLGVEQVQAQELIFNPQIPEVKIEVPKTVWKLSEGPDYKNERLAYYQNLLRERGITSHDDLRLFAANLLVENGALAEDVNGDGGCSVGIPMKNVCQYGYSAKSFRKKYPAWNDWRFQLGWMADHTVQSYEKFKGNARLTIIFHNSPAAAVRGVDACHISPCYYQRVLNASRNLKTI